MAVLHLVSHSPADSSALARCLASAGEGDAVLLIEDAIYAAAEGSKWGETLRSAEPRVAVHVLTSDLEARGLEMGSPASHAQEEKPGQAVSSGFRPVDYRGFVELTTTHHPIVSWI